MRVVPIPYMAREEEVRSILEQVNGVYLAGDSHLSIGNFEYMKMVQTIIRYVKETNNHGEDYLPLFLMGKSTQVFVKHVAASQHLLHNMWEHQNSNLNIRLLKDHNETFFLHQLQFDESIAHAFDMGSFFNRQ